MTDSKVEPTQELAQDVGWDQPSQTSNWGTSPSGSTNPESQTFSFTIDTHTGRFNTETFKTMLYGETGTEKTRTASTWPQPLFVDVDHGMSSVTEQVAKVTIDDNMNGFHQMKAVLEFLQKSQHDYQTVVLDTLNEMQRVILRFTLDEYTTVKRSYGTLPGMSDYSFMLNQFLNLTLDFISLPMKVVLLAQVNSQQFDTDILMPQLVGKNTAREIARKMDIIGYIYKAADQEGTHPEIAFDSQQYVTKDRSNKLPTTLANPTFASMAAFWK
jgi:hypothetical protein